MFQYDESENVAVLGNPEAVNFIKIAISDFKGKKYLKGISNLRKTESFHCHYHKHGESMILNNDYYFKGSPEVMKNPILKWSNVTESITINNTFFFIITTLLLIKLYCFFYIIINFVWKFI